MKSIVATLLIFIFCIPKVVNAHPLDGFDVFMTEIAWMGTTQSPNNEWIELYNISDQPVNIDGWELNALDGIPSIALKGTIPARSFYVLERTDDESSPALADLIYTGALEDTGERLQLFDSNGALIDEINGWQGIGNSTTKHTMALDQQFQWRNGIVDGTPGNPNDFVVQQSAQTSDNETPSVEQKNGVQRLPLWIGIIVTVVVVALLAAFILPRYYGSKDEDDDIMID